MADLGTIGKYRRPGGVNVWSPNYANGLVSDPIRKDGVLSGNVKTAGVNEPVTEVFVFWRPSMALVARTFTDASGNWSVAGLDPTLALYTVVIKDPSTGTLYNDGIFAQLTPA
jgi:hypothetical protein